MLFTLVSLLAVSVVAETIQYCGKQPYYPSKYTCYDGFLCPVVQGERTLKCSNACYLPEAYTCTNGELGQHPPVKGPYEIYAKNTIKALEGKPINACGFHFFLGGTAGTCTYCPIGTVSDTGICRQTTNTTVLLGSSMDVVVPGGQQGFVEANGAPGYTQAHSTSVPANATVGGFGGFDHGYFVNNGQGWLACPASTAGTYQLFAVLDGVSYASNCVGLNVVTKTLPQNTYGAWQYT